MEERNLRKTRVGVVVSDKMDKTIVVAVRDNVRHPLYNKIVKKTYKLKATLAPKNSTDKVTYKSSKKSVATVNSKGVVTLNDDSMSDKPLYVYTILTQTDGNSEVIKTKIIIAK